MFEAEFYHAFGKIIYAQILPGGEMTEEEKELILEVMDENLLPRTGKRPAIEKRPWETMFVYPAQTALPVDARQAFAEWMHRFPHENWNDTAALRKKLMQVLEAISSKYGLVDEEHTDMLADFRSRLLATRPI